MIGGPTTLVGRGQQLFSALWAGARLRVPCTQLEPEAMDPKRPHAPSYIQPGRHRNSRRSHGRSSIELHQLETHRSRFVAAHVQGGILGVFILVSCDLQVNATRQMHVMWFNYVVEWIRTLCLLYVLAGDFQMSPA
eukprot:3776692-Amphidinium_carterae.2